MKNSPWKDGKGDVLRELRQACDEYGLKMGIYLSPWDRNRADYGQPSYVEYFRNQLTELLTQYGDIFEVWFDGANGGWGYYGGANEDRSIDRATYYGWPETVALVRRLQPNCIIWNEVGPDIRWCGNEQGSIGETNWNLYDYSAHIPGQPDNTTLRSGEPGAPDFVAGEVNVSIRNGWFYHEFEDLKVKNLSKLMDIYYASVGRGATWLLNFPIDRTGRIHPADAKAAKQLNEYLKKAFSDNLASRATVSESDSSVTLTFASPVEMNVVQIEEDISTGQRIKEFSVEAHTHGHWSEIAKGTTIGNKRIIKFDNIKADAVRLTVHSDAKEYPMPHVSLFRVAPIKVKQEKEVYFPTRGRWKVISPVTDDIALMFDGDKTTKTYIGGSLPLDLVIDLGSRQKFKGFRYLPDQGDYFLLGIISHYQFNISDDGEHWTTVSGGEFSNIAHNPLWQVVRFGKPVSARYIRFRAVRDTQGWNNFGCAEFDLLK